MAELDVSGFGKRMRHRQVTKTVRENRGGVVVSNIIETTEDVEVVTSHPLPDEIRQLDEAGVKWTKMTKGQWTTSYGGRRFVITDDEYAKRAETKTEKVRVSDDKGDQKPNPGMAKVGK